METLYFITLACLLIRLVVSFRVCLEPISTLYLPYEYNPQKFGFDKNAAKESAYDAENEILYTVGNTNIHVIDIADVSNMTVLFHTTFDGTAITNVETCGDFVLITMNKMTAPGDGSLVIFRKYNKTSGELEEVERIQLGIFYDMVIPTPDCQRVLIPLEAEPYYQSDQLIDPEGAVLIVSFPDTLSGNFTIKRLDFRAYNDRVSELESEGVRFVYRENNNNFSNDVEPEYIALNADGTKAYISLQENNAIAVVDLNTEEIIGVHGLGCKNWNLSALDASDRDGGINFEAWPVFGMYQPDTLQVVSIGGVEYIVTSNEGDAKDYDTWTEEARVKDIDLSDSFESNSTRRNELKDDSLLGRLRITTENGRNKETGLYDELYTYGGRSFSIWRADTLEQVYDSGDDIARQISRLRPFLFNAEVEIDDNILNAKDKRSDNKGPEPESLAVAKLDTHTVLIFGNERPGILSIYSVENAQTTIAPKFECLVDGIEEVDETWKSQYDRRAVSMLEPADIRYVTKDDSPTDDAIVIVTGVNSGTITVLKMVVEGETSAGNSIHIVKDLVRTVVLLVTLGKFHG